MMTSKVCIRPKISLLHELLKDDISGCKQQRHNCASHQFKLKKQQAPSWLQDRGSCRALEASWPFLPQTQHPPPRPPLFTSLDCLFVCLEEFTLCCVQGSLASSGQVRAELPITGRSPEVCLGSLVMLLVGELKDVFKELHSLSSIFFMQSVLRLCVWWRIKQG